MPTAPKAERPAAEAEHGGGLNRQRARPQFFLQNFPSDFEQSADKLRFARWRPGSAAAIVQRQVTFSPKSNVPNRRCGQSNPTDQTRDGGERACRKGWNLDRLADDALPPPGGRVNTRRRWRRQAQAHYVRIADAGLIGIPRRRAIRAGAAWRWERRRRAAPSPAALLGNGGWHWQLRGRWCGDTVAHGSREQNRGDQDQCPDLSSLRPLRSLRLKHCAHEQDRQ